MPKVFCDDAIDEAGRKIDRFSFSHMAFVQEIAALINA